MDATASAAWDEALELAGGRITSADGAVLAAYSAAYSLLVNARLALAPPAAPMFHPKTGKPLKGKALAAAQAGQPWALTTSTAAGSAKLSPLVNLVATASRDLAKFAAELGLTPNSRARAGQVQAAVEDEFDRWLAANRPPEA
jgi:phage terminase small subunit